MSSPPLHQTFCNLGLGISFITFVWARILIPYFPTPSSHPTPAADYRGPGDTIEVLKLVSEIAALTFIPGPIMSVYDVHILTRLTWAIICWCSFAICMIEMLFQSPHGPFWSMASTCTIGPPSLLLESNWECKSAIGVHAIVLPLLYTITLLETVRELCEPDQDLSSSTAPAPSGTPVAQTFV
ncbi:hypothetical protein FB45DRAFT_1056079 [Roridomyces roridus]|uniref:Uncharacterized protein n=1 Tax=Roridomyces roridus TaxID=1738132 RepID=A0AAD7FSJ5_9AGAR|nr:hypothetical protein FB45DRAFT_1056079 [Roridomyces roridus]